MPFAYFCFSSEQKKPRPLRVYYQNEMMALTILMNVLSGLQVLRPKPKTIEGLCTVCNTDGESLLLFAVFLKVQKTLNGLRFFG